MPDSPTETDEKITEVASTEETKGETQTSEASADTTDEKELSSFDVVKNALEETRGETSDPEPEKSETEEKTEQTAEAEKTEETEGDEPKDETELSEEEVASLSERTQRRMRKLAGDAKEAKTQLAEVQSKVDGYDNINNFLGENNLTADDFNNSLRMMAAVRNDPIKGLQLLEPIVEQLRTATGKNLPPDIQEQIRLGYVDETNGRALAEARAQQALTAQQNQQLQERQQQQAEQQALVDQKNVSVNATNEWVALQEKTDPDFEIKRQQIQDAVELELLRSGKVPTKEETIQMLETAKSQVDQQLRAMAPKPKPQTINPPLDGTTSNGMKPQANSLLDAMKLAVGQEVA